MLTAIKMLFSFVGRKSML